MTTNNESQPFYIQVILVLGFIFITFILFALARSIYRDSFLVGRYIDDSMQKINIEKTATINQQDELLYSQTPQYQQKIAKELLGLKLPGEEVIILTNEEQDINDLIQKKSNKTNNELLTNPQKWWRYIFGI